MIDISQLVATLRARALSARMAEYELAWELVRGSYSPAPGEITPGLAGPEHAEDYARLGRLVTSVGARALGVKVAAAVGNVTWGDGAPRGGESPEAFRARKERVDAAIRPLRLADNARKLAEGWNVDGIIAVHAYRDRVTGRPKLTRLTGYLEPYLNPRNMDEVEGLYQAKSYLDRSGKRRWWVRVYDWSGGMNARSAVIREWQDLGDPLALATAPSRAAYGAEVPAVRIGATTEEGLVTSRFLASVPLMLSVMATELSLERARELSAWPIPVFKNAGEVTVVSPAVPVQVHEGGDFYFAEPGNLAVLREHLQDRMARWSSDMNLPAGFIGGNRSGESIREENVSFYNEARADAQLLSEVLTEGLERYAAIAGDALAVPVSVSPNLEYMREMVLGNVLQLVDRELLPIEVAMREVQGFFRTYSDEELQQAIARQAGFGS